MMDAPGEDSCWKVPGYSYLTYKVPRGSKGCRINIITRIIWNVFGGDFDKGEYLLLVGKYVQEEEAELVGKICMQ